MPLAEIEEFLDYLDATKKPGEAPVSLPLRAAPPGVPATATIGPRGKSRRTGTRWTAVYAALAASVLLAVTLGSIRLYRILKPIYVAELCGDADARWSEEGMPEADGRLPAGCRLVLAAGLAEIAFASGAT